MAICNWCRDEDTTDVWKSHICIENNDEKEMVSKYKSETVVIDSLDLLVGYVADQIQISEADLDMATEEDWVSYHQGQLEAYEEIKARLESFIAEGNAGNWVK
jgi:hypothetical protein